jgi:2,4-dienoyl-CoA reductase-like NADH-dependent reductase (Old Yellow Enzyme family)/thioredoxin reductase
MPNDTLPRLAEPIRLRDFTIKNRLVWTAHDTNMADLNNHVSARQLDYFEARAKGGVGLIVMEASSVHPTAEIHGTSVHAYDPTVIDSYREFSSAIHRYGVVLMVQLGHQGVHMNFHKNWTSPWGPSLVPSVTEREIPHVMTKEEIRELVLAYAASAANAVDGGFDGVEVSASHSYLPAQFLSSYYNHREDEYGGSLENRFRFLAEVLAEIRATVGAHKLLGVRLSGDELTEFGMKVDDSIEIAKLIEATGVVDYVSVSVGSMHTRHLIVPPMLVDHGYQIPIAAQIKAAVDLPIIAIGRITDPAMGEQVLAAGNADLVAMTRAQIADPELAAKAFEGRADEIIPCIGCNQGCRERFFLGKSITCTVNAFSGREHKSRSWTPAPRAKTATVVGGGPAGLQAALALAQQGTTVTLYEASATLGGQVLRAASLPSRGDIAAITVYFEHMIRKLGVDVRTGTKWSEDLLDADTDLLVLATGSRPRKPPFFEYAPGQVITGLDSVPQYSIWDAVDGKVSGKNVLVIDERGRYDALGAAELLVKAGHAVTFVASTDVIGQQLKATGDHSIIMARLVAAGVRIIPSHVLESVSPQQVIVHSSYGADSKIELGPIDAIVYSFGNEPVAPVPADGDGGLGVKTIRVGDCFAPRGLDEAIYEGARVVYNSEQARSNRPQLVGPGGE